MALEIPVPPGVMTRRVAYHEAGHAVMAELCGQRVVRVDILGDGDHTGWCHSLRLLPALDEVVGPELPTASLERRILCLCAGPVAESIVAGTRVWNEVSDDLDAAVRLVLQLVGECDRVMPYLETVREHTEEVLKAHWATVERVAGELMRRGSLSGDEVRRLIAA